MGNPEYKRALADLDRVEALSSATMGDHYPKLDLFGTWGRAGSRKSDLSDSFSTKWSYGLQLSVPLFSGLSSVG